MSVSLIDGHIDDDVMTDEQIIKALECCSNAEPCENCPYQKQCDETDLAEIALNLINRQQAEIKRLNGVIKNFKSTKERQKAEIERLCMELDEVIIAKDLLFDEAEALIKKAKADAIKEFAERLKEKERPVFPLAMVIDVCEIDNLVKEMVGAESG